jgi:hypothetical protein
VVVSYCLEMCLGIGKSSIDKRSGGNSDTGKGAGWELRGSHDDFVRMRAFSLTWVAPSKADYCAPSLNEIMYDEQQREAETSSNGVWMNMRVIQNRSSFIANSC